jgi:hypothetical protein
MLFMPSPHATSRIIESPLNPRGREGTPDSDRYFWTFGTVLGVAIWTTIAICAALAACRWLIAVLF